MGWDAIAVRSGVNFTYLAGIAMPGTLARHLDLAQSVRGFMLVWPRRGEPFIVLDAFAEKLVAAGSSVKNLVLYRAYEESLYTTVARSLIDAGLGRGHVGFERDGISAEHWEEIRTAAPYLTMENCSAAMDQVRWIKTEAEIALQKQAADLLDEVYREIFPTIRAGESEREVHARIMAACLTRGFGSAHGILNSSRNRIMYSGESGFRFERGDFVRNDYVAYLEGYAGHQSRLAILGPSSEEQLRGYDVTLDVHRRTIERCRPGVTAGEVYDFVVEAFRARGIDYSAALVGHSMGPWFHQQEPVLRRNSRTVLEAGMILAIEPQREHWHLQDLVLVQNAAPLLLSDAFSTDAPFVID